MLAIMESISDTSRKASASAENVAEITRMQQENEKQTDQIAEKMEINVADMQKVLSGFATGYTPEKKKKIAMVDVYKRQEYVGFSVAYFSALFKKETGEGFAKYLTRIRMEEAKNLLRETGVPVSEICEKVGYNDRKHFTHTFHKLTGVNPAEYRKLYG